MVFKSSVAQLPLSGDIKNIQLIANITGARAINIIDYETLLTAARQQAEPQRLLFVFLKASLPKDHKDEEKSRFNSGQGGALQAVMCVDKTLDELGNFSDLVQESVQMGQDWQIVLVAGLAGKNGLLADPSEAEESLNCVKSLKQETEAAKLAEIEFTLTLTVSELTQKLVSVPSTI